MENFNRTANDELENFRLNFQDAKTRDVAGLKISMHSTSLNN